MPKSMQEILASFPPNSKIIDAVIKTEDHITRQAQMGGKILVSVSGGSDSDIMIDMIEKIGYPEGLVQYAWFDTGLEWDATKRHLCDLEEKYGISIIRRKADVTVPLAVKRYGVPFVTKHTSEQLERLMRYGFDFRSNRTLQQDSEMYGKCVSAVKFWHSVKSSRMTKPHQFDIDVHPYLKRFIQQNPPQFLVSAKCCHYAKKNVANRANDELGITLSIIGVRKAEGGVREATKTCYTDGSDPPMFRPLFWMSDQDKAEYKAFCDVRYSDCYEVWGFKRTGCVGCPIASKAQEELAIAEQYEPLIVRACRNIFGASYAYRDQYKDFKRRMKETGCEQVRLEGFNDQN